jgi:hypothetical protein
MKWLGIAFAVVFVGVVLYRISYPTYSCRYRMTVNVEVDGQLRSGSSVIEFWASKRPRVPGSILMKTGVVGEAVFVDLGGQRNIVALLASGPYAENTAYPERVVRSHFKLNLLDDRDSASLSRLRGRWDLSAENLPTLVTFSNPGDPATVKVLRADQLEQFFGPSVHWRGIVIEMTTDAVSQVIESKLPWVTKLTAGLFGSSVSGSPGKLTLNGPYFKRS